MKIHLILAEDWASMNKAVSDAQSYLGRFGITISTERRNVDVSRPEAYDTTWSWSGLIYGQTKSIASTFIFGLADGKRQSESDCIGLLLDKQKSLYEDDDLVGQQHTLGIKQIIEVYCKGGKKKRFGHDADSYVLIHEILHALADHHGVKDGLHAYLAKAPANLDAYIEEFLDVVVKNEWGVMPAVAEAIRATMKYAESIGVPFRVTEGKRSNARQAQLYNQPTDRKDNDGDGRVDEADEFVTNAEAGESMHNYRVAFDIYPTKLGYNTPLADWKKIAAYAKKSGLEWGGDWKGKLVDKPHFELTFGKSLRDFQRNAIDWSRYYKPLVTPPVAIPVKMRFTRDLEHGMRGEDVRSLQVILKSEGFLYIATPTTYFGDLTQQALQKYQAKYGIVYSGTPASTGYGRLGPKTRAHLNNRYK